MSQAFHPTPCLSRSLYRAPWTAIDMGPVVLTPFGMIELLNARASLCLKLFWSRWLQCCSLRVHSNAYWFVQHETSDPVCVTFWRNQVPSPRESACALGTSLWFACRRTAVNRLYTPVIVALRIAYKTPCSLENVRRGLTHK